MGLFDYYDSDPRTGGAGGMGAAPAMPAWLRARVANPPAPRPAAPSGPASVASGPGQVVPGLGMVPASMLPERGGRHQWSPGAWEAEVARRMGMSNWKNLPGSARYRQTSGGRGGTGAENSGMSGNGIGGFGFGPGPSSFGPARSLTSLGMGTPPAPTGGGLGGFLSGLGSFVTNPAVRATAQSIPGIGPIASIGYGILDSVRG